MGKQRVHTSGIDHVHLNVYELEKAIDLFTSLFACEHNIPLYIDSIDGMNSMNSFGMDVMAPASSDGFYGKLMKRHGGEGISALSFHVEDLDDATEKIESTGIRKISEIGYPGIERQTQFNAKDFFGMSLELVYHYPDALEKVAAIKADQAKENDGRTQIAHQPGAVATGGIHHVRVRVPSVEALDEAIAKFESWFECTWRRSRDGRAAISSLDLHLLVSDDGSEGVDAFGMSVPDLDAAADRAASMGMHQIASPAYLEDEARVHCLPPADCFGVSLVLVESDAKRIRQQH